MWVERWGSERHITKRLLVARDAVLCAAMSVHHFTLLSPSLLSHLYNALLSSLNLSEYSHKYLAAFTICNHYRPSSSHFFHLQAPLHFALPSHYLSLYSFYLAFMGLLSILFAHKGWKEGACFCVVRSTIHSNRFGYTDACVIMVVFVSSRPWICFSITAAKWNIRPTWSALHSRNLLMA